MGFEPILKQFLVNNSDCIKGVSIASRGQLTKVSKPLESKPKTNPEEWVPLFHPLNGICWDFNPTDNPSESLGSAGIGYLKIVVNFQKAFPYFKESKPKNGTNFPFQMSQKELGNKIGENTLLLVAYDRGSFLTSQQVSWIKRGVTKSRIETQSGSNHILAWSIGAQPISNR